MRAKNINSSDTIACAFVNCSVIKTIQRFNVDDKTIRARILALFPNTKNYIPSIFN